MDPIRELLAGLPIDAVGVVTSAMVIGAVVNLAKRRLPVPEKAWPWIALGLGVLLSFAKELDAIRAYPVVLLVEGLLAGLIASGGHEALKAPLGERSPALLGRSMGPRPSLEDEADEPTEPPPPPIRRIK